MNIIEKAKDIKDAIINLYTFDCTITSLGSNIYNCEALNHNYIADDTITIYEKNVNNIFNNNYFQYKINSIIDSDNFTVVSEDYNLTLLSDPAVKLFSGHTQNVYPKDYNNDGKSYQEVSKYPCVVVLPIKDVYNKDYTAKTVSRHGVFSIDIIDINFNHKVDDDVARSNAKAHNACSEWVANRFEKIKQKLSLEEIIESYPFIYYGDLSDEINGYHLECIFDDNKIIRCDI